MLEALLPTQTYFSIREVSELTGVKGHVIRYWETQFSILRPARRDSGQRKFTQKEIEAIRKIKELLYGRGFTIARALRILAQPQNALSFSAAMWPDRETDPPASRSRASHALFGELIRRGLVRRLGSG